MPLTSFRPPGLIAGPADFARVRDAIAQPGVLRDLHAFVRRLADHELSQPVVTRNMEGRRLLHVSREVVRRVIHCGLIYQLDGDERHARRAIADLQAAATFSDWNPSHFLDVGEMCCAFALALDWLHDALSDDERRDLEDALVRLGLEAGWSTPVPSFVRATNNWNAVCNGGLVMGALAVRHRYPELAEKTIARGLEHLPLHGGNYAPAGAFIEGTTYWAYGTVYHVLVTESLLRVTGSTHGLDALPGFRESGDYICHAASPSGKFFSYFDSRDTRIPLPALAWFGRHFDNALATHTEAAAIRTNIQGPLEPILWTENRFFALSLLWLNPAHLAENLSPHLAWSGDGPNPVAFWRESWTPDSLWVASKGGCATLSHGHIDAGSFVLDAGGIRWAVDPGMEEYHRLESMGVNLWGADRWTLFRLGPEGHSIPRIDGRFPSPDGKCPRIHWSDTPRPAVTFDLTALYPDAVKKLHRTLGSKGPAETFWLDDVSGLAAGEVYRFTWVTEAQVAIEDHGVTLSQEGRRFRLAISSGLPVSIRVLDHTELIKANDTPMPDIKRVEFAVVSTGADFAIKVEGRLI